jgi:hypothetical protein
VDHPEILPTPETAAGAPASPLFSSAIDAQHELSALERQWAGDGIFMSAATFFESIIDGSVEKRRVDA